MHTGDDQQQLTGLKAQVRLLFDKIKKDYQAARSASKDRNESGFGRAKAQGSVEAYRDSLDLVDLLLDLSSENLKNASLLSGLALGISEREAAVKKLNDVFVFVDKKYMLSETISAAELHTEVEEPLRSIISMLEMQKEKKKTWIEEAMSLFPDARPFTPEEAEAHGRAIDKMSTPTGRKLYDLEADNTSNAKET